MAKLRPLTRGVLSNPSSPLLTLNSPVSSFQNLERLRELPSFLSRLQNMYKKMFRLRHVIDHNISLRRTYCDILRRRFVLSDFDSRRRVTLNIEEPLSEKDIETRLVNTYAFLFNSTVQPDRDEDMRMEKSIVLSILKTDQRIPDLFKADRKYSWIDEINELEVLISKNFTKKQIRRLTLKYDANCIAFKLYEVDLMRLNESCNLCL